MRTRWSCWGGAALCSALVALTAAHGRADNPAATAAANAEAAADVISSDSVHDIGPLADDPLRLPRAGEAWLRVLAPRMLEVTVITSPGPEDAPLELPRTYHAGSFRVTVDGRPAAVESVGFKRRVRYAPLVYRDLRVATSLYLNLAQPVPERDGAPAAVVAHVDATPLFPAGLDLRAYAGRLRYSPAIHVNQEGYVPNLGKVAMVGYYVGTLGELPIAAGGGFDVVDASGKVVYHGALTPRHDEGFTYSPMPYQRVFAADFSAVRTPGEYRLAVPGLGASLPFRIDEGELMNVTRAYEIGLYHQRCGTADALPYTRFTHEACHTAPAEIPLPPDDFEKAWDIIRKLDHDSVKPEKPELQMRGPDDQLYPFTRTGTVEVRGGHHDAGDYSKYTTNSASFIHNLLFAVDAFPGVAALDDLGIPESGDGVSDLLQEVKWESTFLANMQDADGGFYFLVYPRDRRYEGNVLPDHGDRQIVWPKTTAATAAASAALAECASSPAFRKAYPEDAKRYLAQAERGWEFLQKAFAEHGPDGAYQRLTHYGDTFEDRDEVAWAACALFVATGKREYADALERAYPKPDDPKTRMWTWGRAAFGWGNALRTYTFAARTGRLPESQLNLRYLRACERELERAGDDAARWSDQNAYGRSYPEPSKRSVTAGWFFSTDALLDLTTAYQLDPKPAYERAVLANLNAVLGTNPVNVCFVTGLGQHRQREIVDQYARNDERVLPPSGLPIGDLQTSFDYLAPYKNQLRELSFPADNASPPYPLYDRWSDAYNVTTEYTILALSRAVGGSAFWAARTGAAKESWRAADATIAVPEGTVRLNQPVTFTLTCDGQNLDGARIVWEAAGQEPAFGHTYTIVPRMAGRQWVEAEATWPDGRRVFAHNEFDADAPVVIWFNGALPRGAKPQTKGGDTWDWIPATSRPPGLGGQKDRPQHESALADGVHDHGFRDATQTMTINPGDVLFAYVFIDPANEPDTIMLEWSDKASTEHRAFWGENKVSYGKTGTASRRDMGRLPRAGRWVRLEVPARDVDLEGHTVTGMSFRLFGGRARWDVVGKISAEEAKKIGEE